MSRIEINAGGRHIIIEHQGGELEPMRHTALSLWEATDSPRPSPGPAVGFHTDRRATTATPPAGRSAYDRGRPPATTDAQADHA